MTVNRCLLIKPVLNNTQFMMKLNTHWICVLHQVTACNKSQKTSKVEWSLLCDTVHLTLSLCLHLTHGHSYSHEDTRGRKQLCTVTPPPVVAISLINQGISVCVFFTWRQTFILSASDLVAVQLRPWPSALSGRGTLNEWCSHFTRSLVAR